MAQVQPTGGFTGGFTDKLNQAYDYVISLNNNQKSDAAKLGLAVLETAGGGALLGTRAITKSFTGSIVATVLAIAAVVLFIDAARRVAPVALSDSYKLFYDKMPKFIQSWMTQPSKEIKPKLDDEMEEEIAGLEDIAAAKTFASGKLKITLNDKHDGLETVKKRLQAASTARAAFMRAHWQYQFLKNVTDKTKDGYEKKLRELYQDQLVAKIRYANAAMVLQTEGKQPYPFKANNVPGGIDKEVAAFASQEDIQELVLLVIGGMAWTCNEIDQMSVDDTGASSRWQKLINALGDAAPEIEKK